MIGMGNIIISLDDKRESELRKIAREEFGGKKGSISAVIAEALDELKKRNRRQKAINNTIKIMEKGFDLGIGKNKVYEKRDDIYD